MVESGAMPPMMPAVFMTCAPLFQTVPQLVRQVRPKYVVGLLIGEVACLAVLQLPAPLYLCARAVQDHVFPISARAVEILLPLYHDRQQFRRRALFIRQLFLDDDRAHGELR